MATFSQTLEETLGGSDIDSERVGGVQQLEGIANVQFSQIEKLIWETSTDWNNLVSSDTVVHESYGDLPGDSILTLGYPSSRSGLIHMWPGDEDSGSTVAEVVNGNTANVNGPTLGTTGIFGTTCPDYEDSNTDYLESQNTSETLNDITLVAWVKDENTSDDFAGFITTNTTDGSSGHYQLAFDADNNTFIAEINDGNNAIRVRGSSTVNDGSWHLIGFTYRNSDDSYDLYFDGSRETGSAERDETLSTIGLQDEIFIGAERNLNRWWDGKIDYPMVFNSALSQSEMEAMYPPGHATTDTKTFSSQKQPDLVELKYSLNGQSITLDVIGSPGTASEEVVTQSLDGSSGYTLSWSNSHQDFRIKATIDTTDVTTSPTIDKLALQ